MEAKKSTTSPKKPPLNQKNLLKVEKPPVKVKPPKSPQSTNQKKKTLSSNSTNAKK